MRKTQKMHQLIFNALKMHYFCSIIQLFINNIQRLVQFSESVPEFAGLRDLDHGLEGNPENRIN